MKPYDALWTRGYAQCQLVQDSLHQQYLKTQQIICHIFEISNDSFRLPAFVKPNVFMNNYKSRTVQQLITSITLTITVLHIELTFHSFIYYRYKLKNNSQTWMLWAFWGRHPYYSPPFGLTNRRFDRYNLPSLICFLHISLQLIWIWPIHTALDPT